MGFHCSLISTFLFAVCAHATSVEVVVPHECEGQKSCDIKPPEYEKHQHNINKLLQNRQLLSLRVSESDESEYNTDNCEVIKRPITPYTIKVSGKKHDGKFIAQGTVNETNKAFSQQIMEITCKEKEGTSCYDPITSSDLDKKARCVQQTSFVTLQIYDSEKEEIVPQSVEVNVGCICQISY